MNIKRLKFQIEAIEKAYDLYTTDKNKAQEIADIIYSFRDGDYKTPEDALEGYIRLNEVNKSCENCKFIVRNGEHENDGCNGSHPIELTSADFYKSRAMLVCCNRWEHSDV